MSYLADLTDELARSAPARAAMAMLEDALACRSAAERGAFWHAIDLAYVSRKAPPEAVAPSTGSHAAKVSAPWVRWLPRLSVAKVMLLKPMTFDRSLWK